MNREIMQQALELLIAYQDYTRDFRIANKCGLTIQAIETELAKPEQEPVAWVTLNKLAQTIVEEKYLFKRFIDGTPFENDIACWMADFALDYTAPPRKEWVGLTDDEIHKIIDDCTPDNAEQDELNDFARAVRFAEVTLKEKNT